MKALAIALGSGLAFGSGLVLSGMTDPRRVKAFLTLGSEWDAALLWVMGGAVAVHMLALRLVSRRVPVTPPGAAALKVDQRLVLGAVVFGLGWGITGYCPGPAFVGVGARHASAIVFFVAMMAGMAAFHLLRARFPGSGQRAAARQVPAASASTAIDT